MQLNYSYKARAAIRSNRTRDASFCTLTDPLCPDWSESSDKKDRQGLEKDLGYFHSHD